jgi:hypothetical protein
MSSEEGTISRMVRAIGTSDNSVDKKVPMWVVTLSEPAL